MKETAFIYPATPQNVPASITEPSVAFRKEVSGVMGTIIFFFIVYLLLLMLSIGLVIGCVYAGLAIIINMPKLITIVAGLGLIGVGVMVFIFLIKFMFSVSRYDRSGIIEITEAEQPALFGFVRQLTNDTQTPFPKKIYLSADVNACVFYDSSFWSMFFPVRKNLQIGLGLVNAINISEFKAVMAHEFGHFSQRSMKLGSFVYNVNKIIHNMLFENRGYANFLQRWASIDGIFAFFASITARIAQGIQWILRQMYGLINKSYMRLSREMEFHADAVAASVSGSKSLVTALWRVELAHTGYTIALQKCDDLYRQKKISSNFYHNHTTMLLHLAGEFRLPMQNGLPVVSDEFMKNSNHSRVNFKDQWASHPTTDDREEHLNQLAVEAEILQDSAWVLFQNRDALEKQLTEKLYENVEKTPELVSIDNNGFEEKLRQDISRYSFPEVYNGYYDNRQIAVVDMEAADEAAGMTFSEIFSAGNTTLIKKINAAANDIEVLKAIAEKRIETKTFDFDGAKFSRDEATRIAGLLEEEKKQMETRLQQLDIKTVQFFCRKAADKGPEHAARLKEMYYQYFEQRKLADEFLKLMNTMLESLQPIYAGETIAVEQINLMINDLKTQHEPVFKRKLSYWLSQGIFDTNTELKNKVMAFMGSDYVYFSGNEFFENELLTLNSLCTESWEALGENMLDKFRLILETQLPYKD